MNAFKIFAVFAIGAAVGSACTFKYAKDKYEKRYQEELASMKDALSDGEKCEVPDEQPEPAKDEEEDRHLTREQKSIDIKQHEEILQQNGYTNYSKPGDVDDDEEYDDNPALDYKPYIVSYLEFGQEEGYEVVNATFWADQILTDDANDIVEDVEQFVGFDALSHFGEDENDPDSVYVRNPRLRLDIEICRSELTYKEYLQNHPYKTEV